MTGQSQLIVIVLYISIQTLEINHISAENVHKIFLNTTINAANVMNVTEHSELIVII